MHRLKQTISRTTSRKRREDGWRTCWGFGPWNPVKSHTPCSCLPRKLCLRFNVRTEPSQPVTCSSSKGLIIMMIVFVWHKILTSRTILSAHATNASHTGTHKQEYIMHNCTKFVNSHRDRAVHVVFCDQYMWYFVIYIYKLQRVFILYRILCVIGSQWRLKQRSHVVSVMLLFFSGWDNGLTSDM